MTVPAIVAPGALLRSPVEGPLVPDGRLFGFGGLHGGLALALLTAAMQRRAAPDAVLRGASARLHRALAGEFTVTTRVLRPGGVTTVAAEAASAEGVHVDASAIFAGPYAAGGPVLAPPAPAAPPPGDCEIFRIPPEFVPISEFWEIRPVGANRPYAGCAEPELTAWVRLLEDDEAPDVHRLMLLMDALAPAYAAVLGDLRLVPTMEMSVRTGDGLASASSPWVLLRARTRSAGVSGWNDETIDAWDPQGAHLGSAHQLRLLRTS
ncbi:acyl-CoA thioesterase domain-containing protein [Actinomadura sp. WMMB 499]|uniref:acyl-CoA thioesterase domain-containing protein n=1 Tax=Actinomadura sp. WMMB 499 TaxID=1219491 RepID=UPI0012450076|nr:acyl-CoA thioesterase domain-containing protein [Actinomadura sp. WMMB 499]QFG24939.1 thioesterase family protein [Actinomadura sp. WMMB 499]